MKRLLYSLFIFSFSLLYTPSVFGQKCSDYECVIRKVKKAITDKNYRLAFEQLESAEGYSNKNSNEITDLRKKLFDAVEKEKNEAMFANANAIRQKEIAEKQSKEAIAGKLASNARAVLATEKDFITALRVANAATKVTETPTEEAISSLNDIVSDMNLIGPQRFFNCVKRFGHVNANSINLAKMSQDGKLLITISQEDSIVRLWNTQTGKNYLAIKQDIPTISEVVISLDNSQLLVNVGSGIIKVWNTLTGNLSLKYKDTLGGVVKVFFYDNKPMIIQNRDSIIRVTDLTNGSVFKKLIAISLPIQSFYTSSTGRYIAAYAEKDNKLGIWDLDTSSKMDEVNYGDLNGFTYLSFSPKDKYFALGKYKTIQLYDLNSKKLITNLSGHKSIVKSIIFSDDEKYLISTEQYSNIKLWNISWGQNIQTINMSISPQPAFAISKDKRYIVNYGEDGIVKIWRTIDDYLDPEKSATLNEEQRKGFGIPDWVKD
ncbi:MAG: hypothetical protein JNL70_21015 [Saprospiraceae bacterium]|nr:hypothetical protein [Saprospiraceae bacterium]